MGERREGVSRREFLALAASAAVGSIVGAAAAHAALPPKVVETARVERVEVPKEVVKEVKPWLPEKWDEEADVVVIGAGLAGLCAAIEAHDAGASVILVDKMPQLGQCNSAVCGGILNAWSSKLKLQEKLGIKDSADLQYQDLLKSGDYMGDPELIRTFVENAPSAIDFLVDLGVPFEDSLTWSGGQSVPRTHSVKGGCPTMYRALANAVQARKNIKIL